MEEKTIFTALKNGPLQVSGKFTITGPDGKVIEAPSPAYLCRCGGSHNKPFCDGTHNTIGFHS
ncbi:MAG: CDGSH iron-sulfur domain-containing protein [Bacteroidales bacterium]|nr:CDGSH iron-sulfur domain-containing protein [Bacteroidales bacterium]MCB9013141.1 CDGSH iron-sulfur domain-containing protein [Bacteroidales bacterium]